MGRAARGHRLIKLLQGLLAKAKTKIKISSGWETVQGTEMETSQLVQLSQWNRQTRRRDLLRLRRRGRDADSSRRRDTRLQPRVATVEPCRLMVTTGTRHRLLRSTVPSALPTSSRRRCPVLAKESLEIPGSGRTVSSSRAGSRAARSIEVRCAFASGRAASALPLLLRLGWSLSHDRSVSSHARGCRLRRRESRASGRGLSTPTPPSVNRRDASRSSDSSRSHSMTSWHRSVEACRPWGVARHSRSRRAKSDRESCPSGRHR